MKTAISIPDPVFKSAETLAKRLGLSRSELYSRAIVDFVDAHRDDAITEALNAVYANESSAIDPILWQMQMASLPKEDW